jgi:hypothetical protein
MSSEDIDGIKNRLYKGGVEKWVKIFLEVMVLVLR